MRRDYTLIRRSSRIRLSNNQNKPRRVMIQKSSVHIFFFDFYLYVTIHCSVNAHFYNYLPNENCYCCKLSSSQNTSDVAQIKIAFSFSIVRNTSRNVHLGECLKVFVNFLTYSFCESCTKNYVFFSSIVHYVIIKSYCFRDE